MGLFRGIAAFIFVLGLVQVLKAAAVEDKYEPMVAFICGRPAMHRGVNTWLPDKNQDCPDRLEDVLAYCKTVYPDHNITNVVEASYLVDIPDWPMGTAKRSHPHHVRPFRCLVGGFQSDALLVPQHCEFDHRHDITTCKGFSHWNVVADENCAAKGMHLESLGMLLNCKLGEFNGVEYVCCPNLTDTRFHEPQVDDQPDQWSKEAAKKEADEDEDEDSDENDSSDDGYDMAVDNSSEKPDENVIDLYEAYLRGQDFPLKYNNEHKKFLAAKDRLKKYEKQRTTKLLQEWQKARERVNEVRKTDPRNADEMNKDIADRFQRLYASYEQENSAEIEQLRALHQQHIQASLNEKKRTAMDKYIKALEDGNVEKITKYLRAYIKAEEKDRMHTVNHFEHIKYAAPREALRIHPHIINHLKLSERRIDQALEMLTRFPSVEAKIRPEIEEFLKRFNAIATSIKNVVIPVPKVEEEGNSFDLSNSHEDYSKTGSDSDISIDDSAASDADDNQNVDSEGDDLTEDEHDYERSHKFVAHAMSKTQSISQGLESSAASTGQIGSTIGIALGSVSVFVIIVVAIIMIRRKNPRSTASHGYVEVDPSASPEERHLTNMQMNGYENPTYKYFEVPVQNNPKA